MAIDETLQSKALQQVTETKSFYKSLCSKRKDEWTTIFQEVMSYQAPKRADWSSALKVNFANQIESLVTARMTARNPKFIVSYRMPVDQIVEKYYPVKEPKEDATPEILMAFQEKKKEQDRFRTEVEKWANSLQDYLNALFEEYSMGQRVRQGAKALVRYGNVYGGVDYRFKKYKKRRNGKVEEVKVMQHPEINILSFSEIYLDPRYIQVSESPAVIRSHENVRLSELHLQDDLFNLDKIKNNTSQPNDRRQAMYSVFMIDNYGNGSWVPTRTLTVDKYYGYFNPNPDDPKDESMYEIWTVNSAVVIKYKEIARIPIHSAGCFEDTEQHFSIGYIEPMLGLEREYNFKMNSAVEYINQSLNRSWLWDPNSGINPKSLQNLGPGSVIPAQQGMQAAQSGLQELPYREIPQSYFANSNEVRRDIQSVTFTVDTAATTSTQGFTNTATAVRARFFESNTVYADTLRHFEEFLVRLAFDVLDSIAENATEDIIIHRLGEKNFTFVTKEIFEDAMLRYDIRVEVGSSSFDSVENRREEGLAFLEVAKQMKEAGMDVDFEKVFKEIANSFEKKHPDTYIKKDYSAIMSLLGGAPTEAPSAMTQAETETINNPQAGLDNPAELTQAVVQGDLTA